MTKSQEEYSRIYKEMEDNIRKVLWRKLFIEEEIEAKKEQLQNCIAEAACLVDDLGRLPKPKN